MGKYVKWLAGTLGWITSGSIIGGIVGYLLGKALEMPTTQSQGTGSNQRTTRGGYNASFIVLIAAVLKADGKVLRSELDYVKAFFVRQFGEEQAREATLMLRDVLKQDIPLMGVCNEIGTHMERESRLQLLHLLYGVSASDGEIHPSEVQVLETIAREIFLTQQEYESIRAMFVQNTDWAFKVLELEENASDDDVKKAYRKMAIKFHPDKVSHLGDDHQEVAKQKFQKLNEAYEAIKKERGLK